MTKKAWLITIMFALAITGLVMSMSPVKGSASSSTTSEVSITQNVSFSDKVSVSVEKQVSITQEWSVVDQWSGVVVARAPTSLISEIIRRVVERAVSSFQKITTHGPVFWQGNFLIKWPNWSWIPVGISLEILAVVTIGWRRFSSVPLKLLLKFDSRLF